MTASVATLASSLPCPVLAPGEPAYEQAMATIFFADAAASRPLAVIQPRGTEDVSAAVGLLGEAGIPVTVRGGGLSRECAYDDAVMLDLSAAMNVAHRDGERVVAGGGTTMGTVLTALEDIDHALPIGIYTIPGLGLATRGGIGYLTRSRGLTMDHIDEIEMVLPSGEVVALSDRSVGAESDLWWAARGCAPQFGVVSRVTFRTFPRPRVFVHRTVLPLECLGNYLDVAPGTAADTSVSAVIGCAPGREEPVLFLIAVHCGTDPDGVQATRAVGERIADGSTILWQAEGWYRYMADDMPDMAIPALAGGTAAPVPGARLFSKCPVTSRDLDADTADALARLARTAPSPHCRIDLQHTGGALAAVGDERTAFWGRSAEWNNPVNAIWTDPHQATSSMAWARDVAAAYQPHQVGIYSVELRRGLPETRDEVAAAFGPHLDRLAELKRTWDPGNLLGGYFPLTTSH